MAKIVLDVPDERAESLIVLLRDLSYIRVREADGGGLKVWDGTLPVLDDPIAVGDFRAYSREELHER